MENLYLDKRQLPETSEERSIRTKSFFVGVVEL